MGGRRGHSQLHCVLEKGQPSGAGWEAHRTQLKPETGDGSQQCFSIVFGDRTRTAIA